MSTRVGLPYTFPLLLLFGRQTVSKMKALRVSGRRFQASWIQLGAQSDTVAQRQAKLGSQGTLQATIWRPNGSFGQTRITKKVTKNHKRTVKQALRDQACKKVTNKWRTRSPQDLIF